MFLQVYLKLIVLGLAVVLTLACGADSGEQLPWMVFLVGAVCCHWYYLSLSSDMQSGHWAALIFHPVSLFSPHISSVPLLCYGPVTGMCISHLHSWWGGPQGQSRIHLVQCCAPPFCWQNACNINHSTHFFFFFECIIRSRWVTERKRHKTSSVGSGNPSRD